MLSFLLSTHQDHRTHLFLLIMFPIAIWERRLPVNQLSYITLKYLTQAFFTPSTIRTKFTWTLYTLSKSWGICLANQTLQHFQVVASPAAPITPIARPKLAVEKNAKRHRSLMKSARTNKVSLVFQEGLERAEQTRIIVSLIVSSSPNLGSFPSFASP